MSEPRSGREWERDEVTRLAIQMRTVLLEQLAQLNQLISAAMGPDEVMWAGVARMDQRCSRCQRWIMTGEQIASIVDQSGHPERTAYVHRRCVRIDTGSEGENE